MDRRTFITAGALSAVFAGVTGLSAEEKQTISQNSVEEKFEIDGVPCSKFTCKEYTKYVITKEGDVSVMPSLNKNEWKETPMKTLENMISWHKASEYKAENIHGTIVFFEDKPDEFIVFLAPSQRYPAKISMQIK